MRLLALLAAALLLGGCWNTTREETGTRQVREQWSGSVTLPLPVQRQELGADGQVVTRTELVPTPVPVELERTIEESSATEGKASSQLDAAGMAAVLGKAGQSFASALMPALAPLLRAGPTMGPAPEGDNTGKLIAGALALVTAGTTGYGAIQRSRANAADAQRRQAEEEAARRRVAEDQAYDQLLAAEKASADRARQRLADVAAGKPVSV